MIFQLCHNCLWPSSAGGFVSRFRLLYPKVHGPTPNNNSNHFTDIFPGHLGWSGIRNEQTLTYPVTIVLVPRQRGWSEQEVMNDNATLTHTVIADMPSNTRQSSPFTVNHTFFCFHSLRNSLNCLLPVSYALPLGLSPSFSLHFSSHPLSCFCNTWVMTWLYCWNLLWCNTAAGSCSPNLSILVKLSVSHHMSA